MKIGGRSPLLFWLAAMVGLGSLASACGGGGSTGGTGGSSPQSVGTATSTTTSGSQTPTRLFEAEEPWSKDVSGMNPDARSSDIIEALGSMGGWGVGRLQVDFSLPVFYADASTPRMTVTGADGYCFDGPDCDPVPLQMPVPAGSNMEGSKNLVCATAQNDCHILVVDTGEKRLYELYNSTFTAKGNVIVALAAIVWDLTKPYPENERGDQCTSADAAGFPIAGLLPTADEVKAGDVQHALRFILPNQRIKRGVYVHPASHAGGPSSTDPDAPPFGVRFRLKQDFDEAGYSDGEKVILHALKTYGMLLADGGNIALTFADDRSTTAKWDEVEIDPRSFSAIDVSDFEVVDLGPEIPVTNDCVRSP